MERAKRCLSLNQKGNTDEQFLSGQEEEVYSPWISNSEIQHKNSVDDV